MDRLLRLLRIKPSSAARQAEERIRKADAAITQTVARRKASKAAATVTACALIALMAPGCASFPRAEFRISAFGLEIGMDTRKLTDDIGNVSATMTQAVGLEPLVLDASAATVTAAEPAK